MSLVVESEFGQCFVSWKCLNQSHHSLPSHIVRLYIQTDDGRVLPQHLGDGQSHVVVSSGVSQAKVTHVCVGPQGFGETNQVFLMLKYNIIVTVKFINITTNMSL